MSNQRIHAIIRGRVQGVFFRAHTVDKARLLGLTGWVRNLRDGTAECVAEGDVEQLDQLIAWWQSSPGEALVSEAEASRTGATGEFTEFRTEWTADRAETS